MTWLPKGAKGGEEGPYVSGIYLIYIYLFRYIYYIYIYLFIYLFLYIHIKPYIKDICICCLQLSVYECVYIYTCMFVNMYVTI